MGSIDDKLVRRLPLTHCFLEGGTEKVYVQLMIAEKAELFSLIYNQGAWIWICGDAANMARDVHSALIDIVAYGSSSSRDEAALYIKSLRDTGRFHVSARNHFL